MARRTVVAVLVVTALVATSLHVPPAAASDAPTSVRYGPAVAGPVLEAFDPPAQPWMAGNRGTDYQVEPGAAVVAAAEGEVVFAGAVAGALHVTVRHPDGLRTSYSFLAEVSVHAGQRVVRGQPIGVAGGPVHVGVRTPDGTYLDPQALFSGTLRPRVVLVPGTDDGLDPLAERRSLLEVVLDGGAAAVAFVRSEGGEVLALAAHFATELDPATHLRRAAAAARVWWDQSRDCTAATATVPPLAERRIAVVVSGLGTTSEGNSAWELDTTVLGYDPADVVRFSYRGGRAPSPEGVAVAPALAEIPVRDFTKDETQQSIGVSADRLAELLARIGADQPGVPIDVLAHSQGGVVARLGVVTAAADGRLPTDVENLVTLGSPHQGAPLGTAAVAASLTDSGDDLLATIRASKVLGELDTRMPAIPELAETSDVLAAMRAVPVPDGVRFTSIGASGDLVVPGTATADPQADTHVIVRSSIGQGPHGELTTRVDVRREVSLAVKGLPPTCQGLGDAAVAFVEAEAIRHVETLAGGALLVATTESDGLRASGTVAGAAVGGG